MANPTKSKRTKLRAVLPLLLSKQEKLKLEREAIELLHSIIALRNQRSKMKRALNQQIREKQRQMTCKLEQVELGSESREVLADVLINYESQEVEFYFEGSCRKVIALSEFEKTGASDGNKSNS